MLRLRFIYETHAFPSQTCHSKELLQVESERTKESLFFGIYAKAWSLKDKTGKLPLIIEESDTSQVKKALSFLATFLLSCCSCVR